MAFKPVNLVPGVGDIEYLARATRYFTNGSLLIRVPASNYVDYATSGDGTSIRTIEAIYVGATGSSSAATAYIRAIPLKAVTYVIADCTNNTADNQLNIAHALTDASTVSNTSSNIATSAGVFIALKTVGANSDKKLYGYLVTIPQVAA